MSYIKGPWLVAIGEFNGPRDPDVLGSITGGDDLFIASIWQDFEAEAGEIAIDGILPHGTALANAHLIAAAPELLEALKNIFQVFDEGFLDERAPIVARFARAAIAKAEGQI